MPQLPPAQRKVQLFSHLQQQERKLGIGQLTRDLAVNQERIHPAIIRCRSPPEPSWILPDLPLFSFTAFR